jgi:hypothetical protein
MKNKIYLSILLGLFLISFASAMQCDGTFLGTYKQNTNINLRQTCDTCSYVTLSSITYPNSTTLNINTNMTKSGIEYNYSFYADSLGGNSYSVFGDKDGTLQSENFCFEVTPTGTSQSTSQGIGSMVFLGLMIVLMVVFGFVGFKLSKSDNWWILGIFFMFLSVILLIYNTWLGYEYHKNLSGLGDSSIPEIIFYIFLLILVLGLLTSLALLFLHWKKVFKYIKKEIKRKPEGEDRDVEDWNFKEFNER